MYSVLCEFLLLKPSIDLQDVPEFYKLYYSSRLEVSESSLVSVICMLSGAVLRALCHNLHSMK